MKKYNFYAGPAILPQEVFQEASQAILDFNGMGLSLLEISHRSAEFQAVMDEAYALVREILSLPDHYDLMFLQGGASGQFGMIPMNILGDNETAGYVNTGNWAEKAIKDAKLYGEVSILADSADKGHTYIPKNYNIPAHLKYLHLTNNNTVRGTQYHSLPDTEVKIVADMSSDIFSRPIDVEKYGVIYAGAQKNMGPAGTTLVIVDKNFVTEPVRALPNMMNYQNHLSKQSSYNTPPTFAVYVSMLTLRWVKAQGGVDEMAKKNAKKSSLLYQEIDNNEMFYGATAIEDRSQMSVTFKLHDEELSSAFLELCASAGCIGVKGHRSVGGFRASIYNAMEADGVKTLVDVMQDFGAKKG
ncbi:MAG: 3-phosphoserine/phosphohydroxythreonine transaminase [Saprospiraceae bacterium]